MKGLEVLQNRLGAKDRSGRRRPVPIEGSERLLECGMVITALGREVDLPWLPSDIRTNRNGTLVVDEEGRTTRDGVWACGDVTRVSTIIAAIAMSAKLAATFSAVSEGLQPMMAALASPMIRKIAHSSCKYQP
ncbi:hypothetical protein SDC9_207748 [bioreactor metagenome]|uniref:FAD/NAD(P)-binding domain-containing protein n=1 Tax=bioreactor metagenome TaxID=1076179 RepID=A0A645J8J4_9ZZZZ